MQHSSFTITHYLLFTLLTFTLCQCSKNNIFEQHLRLKTPQKHTLATTDQLTSCYIPPIPPIIQTEDLILTEADIVRPEFLAKIQNPQENRASISPVVPPKLTKPQSKESTAYLNKQANPDCYPFQTHYMDHMLTSHHYYQANRLGIFLHKFFNKGDNSNNLTAFLQEQGAQCKPSITQYYTCIYCTYSHSTLFPTEWNIIISHQQQNPQFIQSYRVTLSAQNLGS